LETIDAKMRLQTANKERGRRGRKLGRAISQFEKRNARRSLSRGVGRMPSREPYCGHRKGLKGFTERNTNLNVGGHRPGEGIQELRNGSCPNCPESGKETS